MGCNCGGNRTPKITRYELTTPAGEKYTYTSDVEARMDRAKAGGGTIRTIREPVAK